MNVRLYYEDCIYGIPARIERDSVDAVVTSPPYNCGTRYNICNDRKAWEQYRKFTLAWVRAVKGALADEGSLFLSLGAPPSRPMMPHSIICSIVEAGIFTLQNTFHWIKSIAVPDDGNGGQTVQRGHYKPINSRRFVHDCHEYPFHLTKRGDVDLDRLALGVPYTAKSNIERWNHTQGSDLHCRGNTWFIPYRTIRDRVKGRPHPATFPVELVVNCIKLHGKCCPIVMDPFLGIGNAAIAAAECEAKEFIGFEIELERGIQRVREATRRRANGRRQKGNPLPA